MPFIPLHVHSEYSLLDSTCRIEQLVARAKAEGQQALAITDQNALYGVIPFYQACQAAGIHPVIGLSLSVATDPLKGHATDSQCSIIVLAKNQQGYRSLVALASMVQMSRQKCVELAALPGHCSGLLALSGGVNGPIEYLLSQGALEQAKQTVHFFKQLFGDDFYLEYQPGMSLDSLKALQQIDRVPVVATCDIHYLDPQDAETYACLRAINHGTTLAAERAFVKNDRLAYPKTSDLAVLFAEIGARPLRRSGEIAAQCRVSFRFDERRLPGYPLPSGQVAKDVLRQACLHGCARRYSQLTSDVQERMERELAIIDRMGFNDYFLIVADLVRHARQSGILAGPGRGSAAGSLIAFLLGITEVDPLKYHLLFERFLNPERITMPDIDLDFPDEDRDKMIAYAYEKYGAEHVAQIITFGTFGARAAIRDAGRTLQLSPQVIDRLARLIPPASKTALEKAYHESQKLRQTLVQSPEAAQLYALAQRIEGLPRHASIHAAGVIFSDQPLSQLVPVQEGRDHQEITQFPMDVLEALGLLKIDFLGLRNLTFMRQVIDSANQRLNVNLSASSIPGGDQATFHLLGVGDTTGIFQLESEGMRQVLRKLKPTDFEDIVAVNALYRPGPSQFIDQYIRRKHQEEAVRYPHPDLEPILRTTYGVLIYQEQIMQIAVKMAGYSLGQADILRRAVSKKKRTLLEQQQHAFYTGCLANGYSQEIAARIFDLIVRFANYGFNRSHAVAYSIIAYRMAYLKTHFPQVFMACYLSSISNNTPKFIEAVQECRKTGIQLLAPSVNLSDTVFEPEKEAIRFGFDAVKNLGTAAAADIVKERSKNGGFKNLYDFCRRVDTHRINRKAIESLIFAGAFDDFRSDRAVLLATLDQALRVSEEWHEQSGQVTLDFDDQADPDYIDVPPLTIEEKMHYEKEALGICLSAPPQQKLQTVLFLRIDASHHQSDILTRLKQVILTNRGRQKVVLHYEQDNRTLALGDAYAVHLETEFIEKLRQILGAANVRIRQNGNFS